MKLNWDDIRFYLAVVEHGSTKRAAAALKVDQTTCTRRIAALETALGLELFNRDQGRYRPAADALELLDEARTMQAAAEALSELADSKRRSRASKLRVTGEEAMATAFIFRAVARFTRLHPEIHVDVDVSSDMRNVAAGQADLAIRGGLAPDEPGLIRRKLGDDPFGIYCGWSYPSPPTTAEDLRNHPIACFGAVRGRLEERGLGANVRHVTNSGTALRRIIDEGTVVGPLPRSVAEASPPLRLCFEVPVQSAIWLVYPQRLRRMPRVNILVRLLNEEFRCARREGRIG
jgi:DNA-binding transcriptional LysR family regulator